MKYSVKICSNSGYRCYKDVESRKKEDLIRDFGRFEWNEIITVFDSRWRLVYCLMYDRVAHRYFRPKWIDDGDGGFLEYNERTRRYEEG